MTSILIVICNHVHYKAFDHVNISEVFKSLFCSNLFVFLYLLADDVILLTELVPGFNFE